MWKLMSDSNSLIHDLSNCNDNMDISANVSRITKMLTNFLAMTPKDGAIDRRNISIFIHSSVPAALGKLYISPSLTKKQVAHGYIYQFIDKCKTLFANLVIVYRQLVPILLEFYRIIRGVAGVGDALYIFCWTNLVAIMERYVYDVKCVKIVGCFPFVHQLTTWLLCALELSVQSTKFIQLSDNDVHMFIRFIHPVNFPSLIQGEAGNERFGIEGVHHVYYDLLEKLKLCLKELDCQIGLVKKERDEPIICYWSRYILILEELESILKLQIRVVLCYLIGRLSKRSIDYQWILEHKEVTYIKIRQCFALKMLPEGRHKNKELYDILICMSHLFEESIEYIRHKSPKSLQGQLFIQFENEEAKGLVLLNSFLHCRNKLPRSDLGSTCPID
ncbi:hypothetical protein R3W88_024588 [Solanum pinnatisectum]|uniref:Uncharacterized protein n=1 Tax=Solanum pinnatisectum TaxID=50273 RepID=A0AAV9M3Y7_9SOLN|nr:hypothetical protein R3W88_024588 [Solanum pinnatisectum]